MGPSARAFPHFAFLFFCLTSLLWPDLVALSDTILRPFFAEERLFEMLFREDFFREVFFREVFPDRFFFASNLLLFSDSPGDLIRGLFELFSLLFLCLLPFEGFLAKLAATPPRLKKEDPCSVGEAPETPPASPSFPSFPSFPDLITFSLEHLLPFPVPFGVLKLSSLAATL